MAGRLIFGAIGDSAPDRWGRVLIQREERRKAREEKRAPPAYEPSPANQQKSSEKRGLRSALSDPKKVLAMSSRHSGMTKVPRTEPHRIRSLEG
jgi:hypothetical protein